MYSQSSHTFSKTLLGALGRLLLFGLVFTLLACGGDGADSADGRSGPPGGASGGEKASERAGGGPPSGRTGGGGRPGGSGGGPPGGPGGWGGGQPSERGVPVEVEAAARRDIAAYFQTQGSLEAENEVDLVARVAGPLEELLTEEGRRVQRGDLLARIDDRELAAQLEVARVRLDESEQSYARVRSLHDNQLVSQEALDQALASLQAAKGEHEQLRIQLDYTRITAPFSGLIVERYVKLAQQIGVGTELFRLSDFDPLLCRIQVPERELRRLRPGQKAEITVEAWGERRFAAHVLRVAPVVDSASGTVRVTLQMDEAVVDGEQLLDPGMFASVYLEMETRSQTVTIPRRALNQDTLTDSVFVVGSDGAAERRDVQLGLRNDRFLEVLSGVEAGEPVIIVGQDGLSDGTPVDVAGADSEKATETGTAAPAQANPSADGAEPAAGDRARGARGPRPEGGFGGGGPGGGPPFDIDLDDPQQVERMRQRMRQRGLSDAEIDQRLEMMRQRRDARSGAGRQDDAS